MGRLPGGYPDCRRLASRTTKNAMAGKGILMSAKHLVLAMMVAGMAGPAAAATITACGPMVCYEYDDAQPVVSLTGLPVLVGDDMQFMPASFLASSSGTGLVTAGPANFVFDRIWTPGKQEIVSLTTVEEFDYEIVNGGDVRATLYMQARSNHVSSDGISQIWSLPIAGDSGGPQVASLTGSLLPAANFAKPADDMRVSIQNTLRANAGNGELAWIQKKFTLVTTVVPVPATVWLLGSGLGVLGFLRRRRSPI